jgi:nicotinamidase-related amidase
MPRLSVLLAFLAIMLTTLPVAAQQLPPSPAPVAVSLDAATTALVVLDITTQTCSGQPNCLEMVPRIASLLSAARSAGVLVVYSTPATMPPILPEVAPADGDPVIVGLGQDRFFSTPLDVTLRSHGISGIMLVGWRYDGSVLYTAVGGTIRTYTVVVPDDATAASQPYDVAVGRYQLLTQLNANPTNEPLKPAAATITRTNLITFQ